MTKLWNKGRGRLGEEQMEEKGMEEGGDGCYCGGEDWEEGGLEEDKEEGGKILEENTLPAAVRSPRLLVL